MKTRILTAVCMAIVLVPVAFLTHTYVYPVLIGLLAAMGCFEMLRCIGVHRNFFLSVPTILLGFCMPVLAMAVPEECFSLLGALTAVLMFLYFAVSLFSHGSLPIDQAGMTFFGVMYVIWGFCSLVMLRWLPHGPQLFLLPFLGAWVSDSFAYFTGRLFGRHKLIPDVSPKKTVEGAIGGIVFAMASFALYGFLASKLADVQPDYLALVLLGLPVSVVSIIGDLVMSLVKRRYEIKDYSRIFPGHGGVLDRFDSVLATSIVLYLLCANTPFFGLLF